MFSVIIPTYNRGHLLSRAIESVIRQAVTDWELIIVDDGSDDNTKDVVGKYTSDYRIFYHYKTRAGVSAARNFGAKLARGSYLIFLDSDDEVLPDMLSFHNENISKNSDIGLSIGALIWDDGTIRCPKVHTRYFMGNKLLVNAGTYAIGKKLFFDVGGFDHRLTHSENWEMMIRVIHHIKESELKLITANQPVLAYHKDMSPPKIETRRGNIIVSSQLLFGKYSQLKWFQRKDTVQFALSVSKNASLLGRKLEAVRWQSKALAYYPFLFKEWVRLLLFLLYFLVPVTNRNSALEREKI